MVRKLVGQEKQIIADRRVAIVDAAAKCFLQLGFNDTSLEQISAKSGVVKQTIYNYFETKEALFRASIDHLMTTLAFVVDEEWYHLEPVEFLTKMGELHLRSIEDAESILFLQLAVKEYRRFPEMQAIYTKAVPEPIIDFIATYVSRCTQLSQSWSYSFAWSFRSAITGYLTLRNINEDSSVVMPSGPEFLRQVATIYAKALKNCDDLENHAKVVRTELVSATPEPSPDQFLSQFYTDQNLHGQGDKGRCILTGALKVFADKGYLEATMSDVALAGNISKQTVYSRFKNKELLYKSFCETTLKELRARVTSEKTSNWSESSFVSSYAVELFDVTSTKWIQKFLAVLVSEAQTFPAESQAALKFLYCHAEKPLEQFLDSRAVFSAVDRKSLAIALQGILGCFVLLKRVYNLSANVQLDEADLIVLLETLIKASSTSSTVQASIQNTH